MKLILIDCDGVLLNWKERFESIFGSIKDSYSERNIVKFCKSRNMENLGAITGAVEAVKFLHGELGYKFHVITHIGDSDEVKRMRMSNLISVFGAAPFYKVTCIDKRVPKAEVLAEYEGTGYWWIDDYWHNVAAGMGLGLKSIHFADKPKLNTVTTTNWDEIADVIHTNYLMSYGWGNLDVHKEWTA